MDIPFSHRISALKPSLIREILKAPANADTITLAAGNPSPESFPVQDMNRIAGEIFAVNAAAALQYGITEGYTPLREAIAARLRTKFNTGNDSDNLIVTSGAQQAIELCAKALLNEGDTVLCEQPSFIGALNALRSYNARLVGVPCDSRGMDMDALEAALGSQPNVKLIYTIPTFQNPSGAVMPLENRRRLLDLAERYNIMVLEDDPYYELRYDGEDIPTIKSLDTRGRVLYVGSFSKLIAPGIRLGYALGCEPLLSKMVVAKQVSDVHSNLFFQILAHRYITECDFDGHIRRCRSLYAARRDVMEDAARRYLSGKADWTKPDGGLFFWLHLRNGRDGTELCRLAKERGVMAIPGTAFMVDEGVSSAVRLNFSLPNEAQIEEGVRRLAEALDAMES